MLVKSLELNRFRNYEKLFIEFSEGVNILYGDNAQGKTNILEAICVCATTKSQKGSRDKEMIRLGDEECHIRMYVEREKVPHKLDMHLRRSKSKSAAMDGLPVKKSSELYGFLHVISFSPEDLSIIKEGPAQRRRMVDMELCQLDRIYLHNLTKYNKILEQRNNLLKQIGFDARLAETLLVWNEQLVKYGKEIIQARKLFVEELNTLVGSIHSRLCGGMEELKLRYEPNIKEDGFLGALLQDKDRELVLKSTLHGPHRDDISFYLNGEDIRKFGSQGQQRTSALSLKLAEIELVKKRIRDDPVLLLDDVLSELDRNRQTQLLDSIKNIQTIITCTGLEEFVKERIRSDRIYHVVQGSIQPE
ncbi:MAG: DNA replication/repair protein RecF [Lachnospiraceae bacterium]|nr:DNA replication/repair protein RecF [Lachnospiraceae bacterium]